VSFLVGLHQFAGATTAANFVVGTNISNQGTVYTVTTENGQTVRRPYTSAGAFLSYGFNTWTNIYPAQPEEISSLPVGSFIPPQDGKIICSDRGADKGTCYLITNASRAGFTSETVFTGLGYSFKNVAYGDVSFLPPAAHIDSPTQAHSAGTLINKNGTVYFICPEGPVGLPSTNVLASWGYSFADIVPANSADISVPSVGVLESRPATDLSPINYCGKISPIPPIPPLPSEIMVYSPNGGEAWAIGSTQTIKWFASSTVQNVDITLSPYIACLESNPACLIAVIPTVIAKNVPNTGSYSWQIPNCASQSCAFDSQISAGKYYVTVTDPVSGISDTSDKPFSISASGSQSLEITTSSLPIGAIYSPYSVDINASGGKGSYSWKITSGSLPPGLSLTSAQCFMSPCQAPATISGTPPSSAGGQTYTFTVTVSDDVSSVSKQFQLKVVLVME